MTEELKNERSAVNIHYDMELNIDAIKDDLARRHPRRMELLDILSRLMLSLISSTGLSVL